MRISLRYADNAEVASISLKFTLHANDKDFYNDFYTEQNTTFLQGGRAAS